MQRSIHDNDILGYSVDVDAKRIVIRTERRDRGEPYELTNLRFEGVLGYFIQDSLGGILLDVEQVEFETVEKCYSEVIEEGARYGWPFQGGSPNNEQTLKSAGAVSFLIQSSIGFDGFVVCQAMIIEAA